jgi:hypothetical protein
MISHSQKSRLIEAGGLLIHIYILGSTVTLPNPLFEKKKKKER